MRSEVVHEVGSKQIGRDFLFQVTNGNLILLFFTTSKLSSIRGDESSLLVQRTCFRGDETI